MSELYYLNEDQMKKLRRYFPSSHGIARVDDRRVLSGIIHVLKRGMQWRDAPREYGPHKTLYNRFVRWSRMGVFDKIFLALSQDGSIPKHLQIDATHLKAHRTAASLLKKGAYPVLSDEQKAA
jgi:transposase